MRPLRPSKLVWTLATVLALWPTATAGAHHHPALPLGPRGLPEARIARQLAPGVTETQIVRGYSPADAAWKVDVNVVDTRDQAQALADRLRAAGLDAAVERIAPRAQDDPRPGPLGFLVRVGSFPAQADADALRARVVAAGFTTARTVFTPEDGAPTTGPWVVHVLDVDPWAFGGRLVPQLGTDVIPDRETVSSLVARTGALAGINGGYFVIGNADGTDGDLAGIAIEHGRLLSEAVKGRASLILPWASGAGARVDRLSSFDRLRASDGATRELDGLNRAPGLIRACGGVGGDTPTELPKHDFTCTDPSEIIRYDQSFGPVTPAGAGIEAVLAADGTVTGLRPARGGAVTGAGAVLSGTGDAADWLLAHAPVGARIAASLSVRGSSGPLRLGGDLGVVNGGPLLLRHGSRDVDAFAEGFVYQEDPGFFYRFGVRRNPRTIAGVTPRGHVLLVTVDGRKPGHSVGASFAEEAAIMRDLGAVDALNLDGGGSTAMVAGGQLLTVPSDATGERPVGDAIMLER